MEWVWDIRPGFQVGDFAVRWYSVIFSLTCLIGWMLHVWQVKRGGGTEREANLSIAFGIVAVFVGGRLGHLVFYEWSRLLADPSVIFRFREGGIASHGATLGIVLATWVFAKWRGVSIFEVTDRLAHTVALGSASIRLGNLFNSEVVGRVTDQTWGVRFPLYDHTYDGPLRHPSQLYEVALGLFVLGLIAVLDRRLGEDRPRGLLTAAFWAVYFTGRFFVEFFKEYQTLPTGAPLTMGQLLSIPAALVGWIGVVVALKLDIPAGWNASGQSADTSS
jgi:prolipoprotein diacylglyceryl transferase